jgi:hypothetical protein
MGQRRNGKPTRRHLDNIDNIDTLDIIENGSQPPGAAAPSAKSKIVNPKSKI